MTEKTIVCDYLCLLVKCIIPFSYLFTEFHSDMAAFLNLYTYNPTTNDFKKLKCTIEK